MARPLVIVVALLAGASANPPLTPAATDPGRIAAAVDFIRQNEPIVLADQMRVCDVPAPPFGETARADVVHALLRATGLRNVHVDEVGNVVADRPGRRRHPHVVFAAHIDTAVSDTAPAAVTRGGSVWRGPGIGDNCRGLAVLVGVARALERAAVQTEGSLTFAATVGEEGLGNLRGVRQLVRSTLKGRVDRFVAIDGPGYGITNVGVGSRRYRVTFRGPGGHSYHDFGRASTIQALGRAVALIAEVKLPLNPPATVNVGRIGGGVAVNSIADEAWMEIDIRSVDTASLDASETQIRDAIERARMREEARASGVRSLTVAWESIGERPVGRTDASAGIVRTALSISRTLGVSAPLVEASTDANVPMSLGIPAMAIGAGGSGGRMHSAEEWFSTAGSVRGTERALLLAVALSRRSL